MTINEWSIDSYLSPGSVSTSPILFTTVIPSLIRPNIVCLPARNWYTNFLYKILSYSDFHSQRIWHKRRSKEHWLQIQAHCRWIQLQWGLVTCLDLPESMKKRAVVQCSYPNLKVLSFKELPSLTLFLLYQLLCNTKAAWPSILKTSL